MPLTVKVEGGCKASLEPRSFSLRQGSAERQRKMANSLLGGVGGQLFGLSLEWTFQTQVSASPAAFCFLRPFGGGGIGVT